jgi:hypothetical protein
VGNSCGEAMQYPSELDAEPRGEGGGPRVEDFNLSTDANLFSNTCGPLGG